MPVCEQKVSARGDLEFRPVFGTLCAGPSIWCPRLTRNGRNKEFRMYCPKCLADYREGFTECADCGVALVEGTPPEQEPAYIDLVTVFETPDPAAFAVAESLLQAAEIDYVVQNEGTENIFPQLGAMQIQVYSTVARKAREVLKDVDKEPPHD
jgi:hypothetical protein